MILVEFSISPLDKGPHVGQYVAKAVEIVDKSGLAYQLTAMGTLIEGEWDSVMTVIKKCFESLKTDCERITLNIKVDYQVGKQHLIESKVVSVEEKLHKKLHTTCD